MQNYFWHMLSYDRCCSPRGTAASMSEPSKGLEAGGTPGFDLLATSDNGLNWVQVTTDGLGDTEPGGGADDNCLAHRDVRRRGKRAFGTDDQSGWLRRVAWNLRPALGQGRRSMTPGSILKSTMPGQVIFDGQRYIAYDDENYPNPGNGKVAVTLESRSYDPFCGEIEGSEVGPGRSHGKLRVTSREPWDDQERRAPHALYLLRQRRRLSRFHPPSASTPDYNDYTFTLQVTDNDGNVVCNKVVVRASKNLPPTVIVETDPPAVFSKGDGK